MKQYYEFSQKGFHKCLKDVKDRNKAYNIKSDFVYIASALGLLGLGVIGNQFIVTYVACIVTSRVIKMIMFR